MKNINIPMEDEEYEKVIEMKCGMTWRDWLLRKDLQKKGEENERRGIHNCE